MRMKTFPISVCLAMLALVPVAAFALGTEVVPIDAWSLTAFNNQRIAPKLIDGSGLSNGGHSTDANGMWMGANAQFSEDWVAFDFGSVVSLGDVKVWNFNQGGTLNQRGLSSISIYASDAASPVTAVDTAKHTGSIDIADWTLVRDNVALSAATANPDYGDAPFSLGVVRARWILFKANAAFNGQYGGLSEVKFYEPVVKLASLASVSQIGRTGATLTGAAATGGDAAIEVFAGYGAADGRADGWDSVASLGSFAAGGLTASLSGLAEATGYWVSLGVVVDGAYIWSDPLRFRTAPYSVSISADASVFENDDAAHSVTFTRPAAEAAEPQTVAYSLAGTASASDYAGLSGSVSFAAGETTASATYRVLDNAASDGNRTIVISLDSDLYALSSAPSATIVIEDDEVAAAFECVWTGQGDGESWNDPGNWSGGFVPRMIDTAVLGLAVANGASIVVAGAQSCDTLVVNTSAAFTLAPDSASGGSLAVRAVHRLDLAGVDEADQTLSVPLVALADDDGFCRFALGGSGRLTLAGTVTAGSSGVTIRKAGTATLVIAADNSAYTGAWWFEGGDTAIHHNTALRGRVEVAGGADNANLFNEITGYAGFCNNAELIVHEKGFARVNSCSAGQISKIRAEYGATVEGRRWFGVDTELAGGTLAYDATVTVRDIQATRSLSMTTFASPLAATCRLGVVQSWGQTFTFDVADGAAAIDLAFEGAVSGGGVGLSDTNQTGRIVKTGAGVMRLAQPNTFWPYLVVSGGVWLCDNASGSGIGMSVCEVGPGGTLGGSGFAGGASAGSAIVLNGSADAPATLAPGSVDALSGAHLCGTLSVGSAEFPTPVTFGARSQLEITFDGGGVHDALAVNGPLALGGEGSVLVLKCAEGAHVRSGTYVVAQATDISGTFPNVSLPEGMGWHVAYAPGTISVEVPSPGSVILLR